MRPKNVALFRPLFRLYGGHAPSPPAPSSYTPECVDLGHATNKFCKHMYVRRAVDELRNSKSADFGILPA